VSRFDGSGPEPADEVVVLEADDSVQPDLDGLDETGHDETDHDEPDATLEDDVLVDGDPLDALDDGSAVLGRSESVSGALPFVVSAREEFAALGDVPITGDARVDAATARLDEVAELPTSDHVSVYDDVHRRLQDALADADVR
jgi:hypothetical protein